MTSRASADVIQQLDNLLKQLTPEQYAAKLPVLNNSSIGQHTRHTVEFFQCLLKGLGNGVVNYDARERNLQLETDLNYTLNALLEINDMMKLIGDFYTPISLAVCYGEECEEVVESSFLRELVYLVEHSIHHFALIRIGIQENFKNVAIPKTFGVAYSTIKFHEEQNTEIRTTEKV
jgi:hypothetical protein